MQSFAQLPRVRGAMRSTSHSAENRKTPAEHEFCRCLAKLGLAYRFQQGFYHPLLKLLAWSDRGRETNKDATDFYRPPDLPTLTPATPTDSITTIWNCWRALGFDMELAGAELLGRDVASICSPHALVQIRALLESEPDSERLVRQKVQTTYVEATPTIERTMDAFRRGLLSDGESD